MTEDVEINRETLNNQIYEGYLGYLKRYQNLSHSEILLVRDFGDYLMENMFNNLKKKED